MKFGIGMFGDLSYHYETKKYQAPDLRLKEIVEEIKLADEVGIDIFAMGEHHREDGEVARQHHAGHRRAGLGGEGGLLRLLDRRGRDALSSPLVISQPHAA